MLTLDIAVTAMGNAHSRQSIVRLKGEYDLARKAEVAALFGALNGNSVCIDFSEVTYMDSTILRELAELRRRDEERSITLVGVSSHIKRILDVVNFSKLFTITD